METSVFWAWVAIAVVCAIVEIIVPSFGLIFASSSAVLGGGAGALGASVPLQITVFAVALVLQLFLLRPRLVRKFQGGKAVPSRADATVGRLGVVTLVESARRARADFSGADWAVECDVPLAIGDEVIGLSHDNLVIKVSKQK